MTTEAIQIYLKEIYFDHPTVRRSLWAYIVSMATPNIDGETQMWVSDSSFKTDRRDGSRDSDDCVFRWDGAGRLIYSGPAATFDALALKLYMVRDASKVRQTGEFVQELFDDGGAGTKAIHEAKALGTAVVDATSKALNFVEPAGQLLSVTGSVSNVVGRAMQNKGDRKLVHADGTLTRELLTGTAEEGMELIWGRNEGDKGYFVLQVVHRAVADAEARPTITTLPDAITARMDHIVDS